MSVDSDQPVSGGKACLPFVWTAVACCIAAGLFWLAIWGIVQLRIDRRWILAAGFLFGLVVLAISFTGAKAAQKAANTNPSPAYRRYNRHMMAAMGVYVFALMIAIWAFGQMKPDGLLAYGLALAPSLPLVAVIALMARYLRDETDEFQRVLMLHSALVATCLLLAAATVWGFLEMFKLVPHVPSWAAFPIWSMGLGVGRAVLAGRYR